MLFLLLPLGISLTLPPAFPRLRDTQEGAVGETTRNVIGGFVAKLLESVKVSATSAAEGAKSAAVNKVCTVRVVQGTGTCTSKKSTMYYRSI